ncbi:MAG: hypothetical protein CM15mP51_21800 [Porticoccaceae bacterium]|nr:MAG: hypothetical protein CM15mP51_21800 [Porticoccaceae bacterium]
MTLTCLVMMGLSQVHGNTWVEAWQGGSDSWLLQSLLDGRTRNIYVENPGPYINGGVLFGFPKGVNGPELSSSVCAVRYL